LEALKKITNRGGQSLEVKQKKEEEVIVQKVLKCLHEEKDVRKGDWNNKEVITPNTASVFAFCICPRMVYIFCGWTRDMVQCLGCMMTKSP